MILEGAKTETIPKGVMVVQEGSKFQRIFQIHRGCCRIELRTNGEVVNINRVLRAGETFGETSFVLDQKPICSVIADSDDGVDVTIIEGYFINTLFTMDARFAGRFYRYLCVLMVYRIRENSFIL